MSTEKINTEQTSEAVTIAPEPVKVESTPVIEAVEVKPVVEVAAETKVETVAEDLVTETKVETAVEVTAPEPTERAIDTSGPSTTEVVPEQVSKAVEAATDAQVADAAPPAYPEEVHAKGISAPTAVSAQPQAIDPMKITFGKSSQPVTCPYCHEYGMTIVEKKAGTCTFLASCVCCFICCPCVCVPFFIDDLKDSSHSCSNCKKEVGQKNILG